MTEFTERFKTYSNTELLKIIDNPDDYQPLAVEAANSIRLVAIVFTVRTSDTGIDVLEYYLTYVSATESH